MGDHFALFKQDEKGEWIWVETVKGLSMLKKRLIRLSSLTPGKYQVYDLTERSFIEPFKKSA